VEAAFFTATVEMELVDQFLKFPRVWQIGLTFLAVIYLAITGMVAVAGGAYQQVNVIDSDFNKTVNIWYHVFVPHRLKSFTPDTWSCGPSLINIDESMSMAGHVNPSYKHQLLGSLQLSDEWIFRSCHHKSN
jgi:hypothetical protein